VLYPNFVVVIQQRNDAEAHNQLVTTSFSQWRSTITKYHEASNWRQ